MEKKRIILHEEVTSHDISRAFLLNWTVVNFITPTIHVPLEIIYLTDDRNTYIHYVEDFKLGLNYLVVVGEDIEPVIEKIHKMVPTYTKKQIVERAKIASTKQEKILTTYYLALIAPMKYESDLFTYLEKGLCSNDHEIRGSTALAIAYVGWDEFIVPLQKAYEIEQNPSVKNDLRILLQNIKNSKQQI